MKRRNTIQSIVIAAVCAATGLTAQVAMAQTKLKWAHVYETTESYHKQALWAASEVKNKTGGRVEIDVFPSSQLGKETDINQGLTLGTVDIIYTGMAFAGRTLPALSLSSAPFAFRDHAHWQSFRASPLWRELADQYEAKSGGHQIVGYTYYGMRHMTSNKPIVKPEDMKGLKLRVPDAPIFMMFPKAVGANPTPIAFAEVYLALQNGTVDAQENPLPTIDAKKFYEVQKFITLTGHITESLVTVVASSAWKKISPEDRKTVESVLWDASTRSSAEILDAENKLADHFVKLGKVVNKVDRAPFATAVRPLMTASDAPWSREVFERLQALK
jgi:tripartite ATP-independent transporter DctP family solute receptor